MNVINKHIGFLEELLNPLMNNYRVIGSFDDWESGQGMDISWFEMFARSAYGILAYTSVVGDNDYLHEFNNTIHKAIRDVRYQEWYDCDQKAVELIPIITLLLVHRPLTWEKYTSQEKEIILDYFSNINRIRIGTDNWQFFRLVVTKAINNLGGNQDVKYIEESWNIINECYCGDGWYRDGKDGTKDYYIAFGYHFYSLLYRYLFPDDERCEIIKERALLFAKDYQYMFDAEGRMIAYGRSMIYRFASLSFWSMLLCNHISDEEGTSQAIRIIDRGFDWWKQQKITRQDGSLNLGYAYRNEYICEDYNSSGSPYWALKAFLFFLDGKRLKEFEYTDIEQKCLPEIKRIANGDAIVVITPYWNTLYINSYSGGGYLANNSSKYFRFAYSSALGFNLSRNDTDFRYISEDNSLIFNIAGVKHQRESNLKYYSHDEYQEYTWACGDLIFVHTYVIPRIDGYIRIHIIKSQIDTVCYETGFAYTAGSDIHTTMKVLNGCGEMYNIANAVNSNIYSQHTRMNYVKYQVHKGMNMIADYTYLSHREEIHKENEILKDFSILIHGYNIELNAKGQILVSISMPFMTLLSIKVNAFKSRLMHYVYKYRNTILDKYNNSTWPKNAYRKLKRRLK